MGSDRKQKVREMREICSPKERERGFVAFDRWVYVPIGFLFTRLLVRTRVTPNQITMSWGLLIIFLSFLFLFQDPWLHAAAALGWIIVFSLDNTDGQIARYKGMCSERGILLDEMNHCATWPVLFMCVGLGEYFVTGEIYNVVFAFTAGISMMLIVVMPIVFNLLHRDDRAVGVEKELMGNENRFRQIMNINPMTFINIYPIILAVVLLDMALVHMAVDISLMWMTSLLSMLILFYGIAFPIAFAVRTAILYRKMN